MIAQTEKINIEINIFLIFKILLILIILKKIKGIKKKNKIENIIKISLNKLLKYIFSFSWIPVAAAFNKNLYQV